MNHKYLALIALTMPMAAVGCAMDSSPPGPETVTQSSQASSSPGVWATISQQSNSGGQANWTVTVTNNTPAIQYNWNVTINLNGASYNGGNGQASAYAVSGGELFVPGQNGATINANGGTTSFGFSTRISGNGTVPTPIVSLVDGVPSKSPQGAKQASSDQVDHVSRAAAAAALNIGQAYEANKRPNNGDAYYPLYDDLVLSAHAYALSSDGKSIVFDSSEPGYAFIPQQAMGELQFAQQDAATAAYLVAGLIDCLAYSNGQTLFDFKTEVFGTSGTVNGGWPQGQTGASAYNGARMPFTSSTTKILNGQAVGLVFTLHNQTAAPWAQHAAVLSSNNANFFTSMKYTKFTGGSSNSCSPFNGPGGGNGNPYFMSAMSGGQAIPAHFDQSANQCGGPNCMNLPLPTVTVDPDAYTQTNEAYDVNNNLIGPQSNPFAYDSNQPYAKGMNHCNGVAPNGTACTELMGVPQGYALESDGVTMGQFSSPVTILGVTKWLFTNN